LEFRSRVVSGPPSSGDDGFQQATWRPVVVDELLDVAEEGSVRRLGVRQALGLAVLQEVRPDDLIGPLGADKGTDRIALGRLALRTR
jgi:hypothetical protein